MNNVVHIGQRLSVGFLVLLLVVGCTNVIWGVLKGTKLSLFLALASVVSCLFAGATAWNIFYWKPVGRYLGFFVVLQHLSFLVNWRGPLGLYTKVLTVLILLMGIWLLLPEVKQKFGPLQKA